MNCLKRKARWKLTTDTNTLFLAMLLAPLSPTFSFAAAAADPTWDPKWFAYDPPKPFVVEETTPTAAQVDWIMRPPVDESKPGDLKATSEPATPRRVGPIDIVHLRFVDVDGDVVPALLCTPAGKKGPFPVVIATHGLTSHKAQVCAQVAPELAKRGFAVLAADMPRHGERPGQPRSIMNRPANDKGPDLLRQAVHDVRQLIDIAERHPDLDTKNGVLLLGFSMGSWVSAAAGPSDDRVKGLILMVGGAANISADAQRVPSVAQGDPRLSLARFSPRPILMLNGRQDFIVKPDMANRLFDALQEPKKQIWYDAGHLLEAQAFVDAADWAETRVKELGKKKKSD